MKNSLNTKHEDHENNNTLLTNTIRTDLKSNISLNDREDEKNN